MSLKTRVRISSTLPHVLEQRLKDYSEESLIPMTKIIEKALDKYLESKTSNN